MNIPNIGYSFGFVERFLEMMIESGVATASTSLEHLKTIETAYTELANRAADQETKLNEIQLNLSGWKKI
jgi:hypothetical protein